MIAMMIMMTTMMIMIAMMWIKDFDQGLLTIVVKYSSLIIMSPMNSIDDEICLQMILSKPSMA